MIEFGKEYIKSLYGKKYPNIACPRCNNDQKFIGMQYGLKCAICNMYLFHPMHLKQLR